MQRLAVVLLVLAGAAVWSSPAAAQRVWGDFNGDGFGDLAVGVPGEDVGAVVRAGAVTVLYGRRGGLSALGGQLWHQNLNGVADVAETEEAFGGTLAAGDFNNDGFGDLAIGVSSEDVGGVADAGAVTVLYGRPRGLSTRGGQLWHQNGDGVADVAEQEDFFGDALAAGDFDGNGIADLAIGVPYEDVGAVVDAGAVTVLYGRRRGLSARGDQLWHQNREGVADAAETDENFGYSLAAANLGRGPQDELAIGVPWEDTGAVESAGAVSVLYGRRSGLSAQGDQFWHQNRDGVADTAEANENFGFVLAAANLGRGAQGDLAIGVPFEDVGAVANGGAVSVLYGGPRGLSARGEQLWHQNREGVADAAEAEDRFGSALAAADLGRGAQADLAIGTPLEDVGAVNGAGAVSVLYGRRSGLSVLGDQLWHQNLDGVADVAEPGDSFGWALAAGDLGRGTRAELAIGVIGEDVGAIADGGAVSVLYGRALGLSASRDQFWHQNSEGVADAAEVGDFFGLALEPRH